MGMPVRLMVPAKDSETVGQGVEKTRGYHGEWSLSASPKAKTSGAAGPKGFGQGLSKGVHSP